MGDNRCSKTHTDHMYYECKTTFDAMQISTDMSGSCYILLLFTTYFFLIYITNERHRLSRRLTYRVHNGQDMYSPDLALCDLICALG